MSQHGPGIGAETMGAGKYGYPGWHEDADWHGWWTTPISWWSPSCSDAAYASGMGWRALENDYRIESTPSPSGVTHLTLTRRASLTADEANVRRTRADRPTPSLVAQAREFGQSR